VGTTSIIKAMNKPRAKNQLEIQESVGPAIFAGPVGKWGDVETRAECEESSQWLSGDPQSGKGGGIHRPDDGGNTHF
jgi:hypothetical protein